MNDLKIHRLRDMDLKGGTLLVGIPHQGIGTVLLTEFIVEQGKMDQAAAFESDDFPPVTILHEGRPRSALRIHASEEGKIAVLRCEFPPAPGLARQIAAGILEWCGKNGIARVVTLDGVSVMGAPAKAPPSLLVAASHTATRERLGEYGIDEFQEGALGGVPGILLTEGRRTGVDVVALMTVLGRPQDDLEGAKAAAIKLPLIARGLKIDGAALDAKLTEAEESIRALQEEVERSMGGLPAPEEEGKEAQSMFR